MSIRKPGASLGAAGASSALGLVFLSSFTPVAALPFLSPVHLQPTLHFLLIFPGEALSLESRSILLPHTFAMAPITDDVVDGLKSTIGKLEARIEDLESRLVGGESKPKSVAEHMRLILMGPPGAGTLVYAHLLL